MFAKRPEIFAVEHDQPRYAFGPNDLANSWGVERIGALAALTSVLGADFLPPSGVTDLAAVSAGAGAIMDAWGHFWV